MPTSNYTEPCVVDGAMLRLMLQSVWLIDRAFLAQQGNGEEKGNG